MLIVRRTVSRLTDESVWSSSPACWVRSMEDMPRRESPSFRAREVDVVAEDGPAYRLR